jgi:Xaa-Pro aminopeptidase
MRISEEELAARRETLAATMDERGLNGCVLFDPHYVLYYSGFHFIPTERPIALVLSAGGAGGMLVPRLELEHAQANTAVQEIVAYDEYPGERHPMEALRGLFAAMHVHGRIGADNHGYPRVFGYRGPVLEDVEIVADAVEDQMAIKSGAEVELLRESAKWANLAHTLLQRYTRAGVSETEVTARAGIEATAAMLDAIGPLYRAQSPWFDGAVAGYRGQIGRNAAIPHAHANDIVFAAGDVLVTGATAPVWGYHSELERTMVIGEPSDEQRRMFEHMLALQDIAFDAIRPGAQCADVDLAVRGYYEAHGLWETWRHHVGHAIGIRYHEGPFLDRGDRTEIRPGMVFTVEPGLYVPSLGGFRHSDTVAVTDAGLDFLTYYPRDLESLTLAG